SAIAGWKCTGELAVEVIAAAVGGADQLGINAHAISQVRRRLGADNNALLAVVVEDGGGGTHVISGIEYGIEAGRVEPDRRAVHAGDGLAQIDLHFAAVVGNDASNVGRRAEQGAPFQFLHRV